MSNQIHSQLICLTDISRYYQMGGETITALDKINLSIQRNEYMAFIGASGSGKSTMIIVAYDLPNANGVS